MLSRFKDWYVFKVFGKIDAVVSLGVLIFICIVGLIFSNLCGSFKIDAGKLIWGAAGIASLIIIANVLMNFILGKILFINPNHGKPEWKKYFVGIDKKNGRIFFKKQAEYAIIRQKSDKIFLTLSIPKIGSDNRKKMSAGEIAEKNVGSFFIDCEMLQRKLYFCLSIYYKGQYDVEETASFIFANYLLTGRLIDYTTCLKENILEQLLAWMNEAEEICDSEWAKFEDANIPNTVSDDEIAERITREFLRIANEKFRPKLLSNIVKVRIGRSIDEDSVFSPEPEDGGQEKIEVPQDNQN